jgi:hypothetical protein
MEIEVEFRVMLYCDLNGNDKWSNIFGENKTMAKGHIRNYWHSMNK